MDSSQTLFILAPCPNGGLAVKRDMELVREIMLHVETKQDLKAKTVKIDGYADEVVARHVEMLLRARFLEGIESRELSSSVPRIFVTDLTWEGHDFLAATQNKSVWTSLKSKLGDELPKLPFELVKSVALKLLSQSIMRQVSGP